MPARSAARLGVLVGPGVVAAGPAAVAGLRTFAAAAGTTVVNTWGAKGVFRWDDPHHAGTVGLQARDLELAGLGEVDVLVTSGLDPAEVPSAPWAGRAEVVDVAPAHLATAAERHRLPPGSLDRPPFYDLVAAVVGPSYASTAVPPPAPRLAAELAAALPPSGVVVADPGLVGFWVARTFPTSVPGSVVVPATGDAEAAWATARRLAAAGRPVTYVTGQARPPAPGVVVVTWRADEVDLDPAPLVAVAGPIVAWGGVAAP